MIALVPWAPQLSIAAGGALAAIGVGLAFMVWQSRRRRFLATHGPTFIRLCRNFSVTRLERWRLQRLAYKAGLITPAVLLISRGAFENALVRAAVAPEKRWIQRFRQRVFTPDLTSPDA